MFLDYQCVAKYHLDTVVTLINYGFEKYNDGNEYRIIIHNVCEEMMSQITLMECYYADSEGNVSGMGLSVGSRHGTVDIVLRDHSRKC